MILKNKTFVCVLVMFMHQTLHTNTIKERLDALAYSWMKYAGMTALSVEDTKFIRNIAKKLNAPDNLVIGTMNKQLIQAYGSNNASIAYCKILIIPISSRPFLLIGEDFFAKLSNQEKEFVIAHEIIHVLKGHQLYEPLVAGSMFFGCQYILFQKLLNALRSNSIIGSCGWMTASGFLTFGYLLAYNYYQRHCERVADMKALEALHCYNGCLAFMNRCEEESKELPHLAYNGIFANHPAIDERKEYCKALQEATVKQLEIVKLAENI